ncbi:MAG TPA: GlxA family transcriptional regulator [Steroidobacteraceae bacterium]|nr:GlxA family transcriptional regulator [Steroidobacteraceae bacterium]
MRKVAFLVLPEFSNLGLAAATEPLFVANWLSQKPLFEWKIISVDGRPVRASDGRVIEVDGPLLAAEQCKTVFVLASFDPHRSVRERPAIRWLKRIARFGVEIGGIENGSLILAEAGLLNGHQAAVHWDNSMGFQEHYPKTRAVSQLFVRSRDRITCAGAAATLDMMVAWIEWHGDAELAGEVALHLLLGRPRSAETPQRGTAQSARASSDAVVFAARALMSKHVDEPLTCAEIARRVGLSLRQIERRFQDELRCSVLQQYRQIRMAKAHQLLQQTDLSVTQIAFSCGFASPEYFCRLYRSLFGCSPSHDRRQSTTAPVLRQQVAKDAAKRRVDAR